MKHTTPVTRIVPLVLTKKSMVTGWLPADAPVPRRLAA
jgi:hypothetical protein